ncbi:MAG: ParB/RepB/Spo0J family partition protein [Planctomycetes bacterium]|nr:ParB/RepB/Spo0J family partition protein [Planctomycetota bacterium]
MATKTLQETDVAQPEYEDRIRKIPLDSLTAGITNVRTAPGDVTDLAESLKVRGLEHPILVRSAPSNPGMFEVIAGSRRLAAARELGWKRIDARSIGNCDDVTALCLSLDENQKRGDLSARELGEVINKLITHYPEDPGDEKAVLKWVAKQLNWFVETPKGRRYPDVNRVRKAQEDAEFQKIVPGITIKVRNRGDYMRPTAPLSVARQVMPILSDPRVRTKLEELAPEQAQRTREEFLREFGKTESKRRKDVKDAFIANPLRPIREIAEQVERERAQQVVVAFKVSPDLLDRIDSHKQATNGQDWTRSDALKDLVERGLRSVGL